MTKPGRATRNSCQAIGCSKPVHGQGFCTTHYARLRRNGELPNKRLRVTPDNANTPSQQADFWAEMARHLDAEQVYVDPDNAGDIIRHIRILGGADQNTLAEYAGTDQATISRWENGRRITNPDNRANLANALDTLLPCAQKRAHGLAALWAHMADPTSTLVDHVARWRPKPTPHAPAKPA